MLRPTLAAVALALLASCGDDDPPLETTPQAELCGAPGPFHLLPLAPDERVGADPQSIAALGERLLFIAGTGERRISPAAGPQPEHTRVYSVGRCGEDPLVVADDLEKVFVHPRWPERVLGCPLASDDLVRIDLSGASEPTLLARDACNAFVTEHGLLSYNYTGDSFTAADFHPLLDPDGPYFGPPIEVVAPLKVRNSSASRIALRADEVLLVEDGGDLVSIALPDLGRTVLQSGVVLIAASADARYLLYQLGPATGDDPYNPIGDINLLDRSTHVSTPVGTGTLGHCFPCFPAPGLARVDLVAPEQHQRLITLPDFQFIDAPAGQKLVARLPDGRWFSHAEPGTNTYVIDLPAGSTRLVSSRYGLQRALGSDHVDLLLLSRSHAPQKSAPLVRYFFDDRQPQTLAEQANVHAMVRADDRVLTMRHVDAAWLGELTLVDPDTREVTRIDDHVIANSYLAPWHLPDDPDTLVYAVVDGERTGVWLARPTTRD